ncbi:hypothetical protein [Mucilaginibacter sp. UYCu711]|uniref:hypothetical protein n=1 Tax=Mucilaginibacter sp. UYCu711 TaxID=3156339 RepID=UPI003D2480A2
MYITEKLIEGLELLYIGKSFAGFKEEDPYVIFLGYDSLGWSNIWVKYKGRNIFTSIFDVAIMRKTL